MSEQQLRTEAQARRLDEMLTDLHRWADDLGKTMEYLSTDGRQAYLHICSAFGKLAEVKRLGIFDE
jgi:hypothetical protein